jgi:hypothetical protein
MSKIRTIYNPGVGIVYKITNRKTGEQIEASTLTTRDAEQKPWRSPRGTKEGEEFFKMKSGTKKSGFTYFKFMNSIKNTECLTHDGEWLFTGLKPNGTVIPKLMDIVKKEKKEEVSEISGNQIRYTVEKIDDTIAMSEENIKEKVESINTDDFSDLGQLSQLLAEKELV